MIYVVNNKLFNIYACMQGVQHNALVTGELLDTMDFWNCT